MPKDLMDAVLAMQRSMTQQKRQRHIGYILVPTVDDGGKTLLPSIWRAWSLPIAEDTPEHQHVVVWTSRTAANRAHRKIFGVRDKTMKVYRIRLEKTA